MKKNIPFLIGTLFISFLIHSMDAPSYIPSEEIIVHKKDVNRLCADTSMMLHDFKCNGKTSARHLIGIIEQTNCLKQAKITEKEIGFFSFNQKQSVGDAIKKTLSRSTISPFCASIFFARLEIYNQSLAAQGHVSPNTKQLFNHWKNKKIDTIAATTALFGVPIPNSTLVEKRIPTQSSIAVTAFDQLMLHISKIISETPKTTELAARLIYHNELKNQSPYASSRNQDDTIENSLE